MMSFYVVSIMISCVILSSPGDIIGTTCCDFQGSLFGQRLYVDDYGQAHIDWMKLDAGQTSRFCAWNARYADGTYYGETQASPSWSGCVQIDVTRDADPANQRSVICYHYNAGAGYFSWIDIDAGNLWGAFGNPKTPAVAEHIWPRICVVSNNNILMATGDYTGNHHHIYLTTDEGNTWSRIIDFDSCSNLTHFVRASHNPGSNKVVFVHTQYITDTIAGGLLDQDVWYMLSTDGGATWGPHINVTNYQSYPTDSVRAFSDVNAVFDIDDNIHIAWTGRKVDTTYHCASKVFHWDEVNDTITIVNNNPESPGGWWTWPWSQGYGAWRLPSDEPQLITGTETGYLYCLWHGQTDTTDTSAAGWSNGDLYGAFSTDNGITWSHWVNLTNTHSPGALPGECEDEDYMTANPFTVNDSIFITFIEDKDAGSGGTITVNPVYCWVFHKSLVEYGVEEVKSLKSEYTAPKLEISPNPFKEITNLKFQIPSTKSQINTKSQIIIKIYDSSGRLVRQFDYQTIRQSDQISWNGTDNFGHEIPAGVYFIQLKTGNSNLSQKVIKCK